MKSFSGNPLTKESFACIIGRTIRTVDRYIEKGLISIVKVGNRVMIPEENILKGSIIKENKGREPGSRES